MREVVTISLLQDLVAMKPPAPEGTSASKLHGGNRVYRGKGEFDVGEWIETHQVLVLKEGKWDSGEYKWVLAECPWNGHTDNAAFIVRWPDGTIGAGCHHNSCQEYGWRELREHYEPGCYDKQATHRGFCDHAADFSFPTQVLPRTLRLFVEEAAASIGCPPDYIGVPMLATLGAAIGNSRVLAAKDDYMEGATLYTAIIGEPGSSKSPALKEATAPASRKQEELTHEYKKAMAEYNRKRDEWCGEDFEADPPEPVYRRTIVQDTTVEALTERLQENPKGLLSNNDELSGWLRSMDQYKGGKGSDRQFWLSTWTNASVTVDRKGKKDPIMISRSFVGIAGGVQPSILSELKNEREDGLMDRFLFAYPEFMPSRWSDSKISSETKAAYQGIYEELYGLGMDTDENGVPSPRPAIFIPEAKQAFIEAYDLLCEEMEDPDLPQHLKGVWSKMRAYLVRISLIIGMARIAQVRDDLKPKILYDVMKNEPIISEADVEAAIALIEYFKAQARKVYGKLNNCEKKGTNKKTTEDTSGNNLLLYLIQFLKDKGGYWEGMTSQLYEICEAESVPGLPGGNGAFGKELRKIAKDQNNELVLDEGHRGSKPIVKLSLATVGTEGNGEDSLTESTKSTEGKGANESFSSDHLEDTTLEGSHLELIAKAMEELFRECPEHEVDPDPALIAMDLFFSGYLDFLPDEGQIQEALDPLSSAEQN